MTENIEFLSQYSSGLMEQFYEHKRMMIKIKLQYAKHAAEQMGDYKLLTLLAHMEKEDLERVQYELEQNGYTCELHMPQDVMKHGEKTITFDFTGMKLVIRKIVLEV